MEPEQTDRAEAPLTRKAIRTIRIYLPLAKPARELALFDLAIDSKWRVRDAAQGDQASVIACGRV